MDNQTVNILLVLGVGLIVGLIWIGARIRQVRWIYLYGVLLIVAGIMGWLLMGRSIMNLLSFQEVTGFGRAYLAGAMMIVSGLIYNCYSVLAWLIRATQ